MNPTVILRSVGAPLGNLWKTSLESEKKRTRGKQLKLPLGHEFIRMTRRAIQTDDEPGLPVYKTVFHMIQNSTNHRKMIK